MKVAYFDLFAGASGDLLLGALLDAGLALDDLLTDLARVPLGSVRLTARRATRCGVAGTQVEVQEEAENHPTRDLAAVEDLLQGSGLAAHLRERIWAVFQRMARAEAAVRGIALEQVELYELFPLKSIVEIIGFVCGLEHLGIGEVYGSPLPAGGGAATTEQGRLPIPAPATLALLAEAQAPLAPGPVMAELVTPTGAALLSEFARFQRPTMTLQAVGYGLGAGEGGEAHALRVWLGEQPSSPTDFERDEVVELACNLDNATGELLGYVLDRLMVEGALDAWFTPIQMKKDRPAVLLAVLASTDRADALAELMLRETPTLGVRRQAIARQKAGRETRTVETSWGPVRVKAKILQGEVVSIAPEYDDCARLAREAGVPLAQVMEEARQAAAAQEW